ncbi:hypothetical protein PUN28_019162 [Cardiocondyla obscurior]|uniref:THAP-type domain-containing protein n=1 Tax=Cardiocondyla obscurior TaxID=286306 RepID=A0AAW2EGD8_9HYME
MPKRCVVLNCSSATSREKCISHFFSVICDLHFKKDDFTTSEIRRRLKSDVIPSLYIHNVQTIQFLEKKFEKKYETRMNKIKSHFQQQQQKSENKLHIKNEQLKIL